MNNMNMDNNENQEATVPVFEFTLPANELDSDVKMGQTGEVIIPVEVISLGDNAVTFRKVGMAYSDRHFQDFKDMPASEMRKRMKVLKPDEMEKPFKSSIKEEK